MKANKLQSPSANKQPNGPGRIMRCLLQFVRSYLYLSYWGEHNIYREDNAEIVKGDQDVGISGHLNSREFMYGVSRLKR
jgi:hypothetical protein